MRLWSATAWPKQFTVRTLLAAMVLVALVGPHLRHHDEPLLLFLGWPSQHEYMVDAVEIRGTGPAWVRQIIGPWPLSRFDKITGLSSERGLQGPGVVRETDTADARKLAVYGDVQHVGPARVRTRQGGASGTRSSASARADLPTGMPPGRARGSGYPGGVATGEGLRGESHKVPRGWYSVVRSPAGPTFCGPEPVN